MIGGTGVFDLVIGDFGRAATLRYFQTFSGFERQLLVDQLKSCPFYDEYRRIRYLMLGVLPDMKSRHISEAISEGRSLNDQVLIGVSGGIPLHSVERDIAAQIIPWLSQIIRQSPDSFRRRLVIPCNTLAPFARKLRTIANAPEKSHLDEHDDPIVALSGIIREYDVDVLDVVSIVAHRIAAFHIGALTIVGTHQAFCEYISILNRLNPAIKPTYYPEDIFVNDLRASISGTSQPRDLKLQSASILSACTDLDIPNALDSLTIFAEEITAQAYAQILSNEHLESTS